MQPTSRQQLWIALANLFLDTDVTLFYADINRVIAEQGCSDSEVERVLIDEVEPALRDNLTCLAGEWSAFDDAWVVERITAVLEGECAPAARPWSLRGYARQHLKALQRERRLGPS